MKGLLKVALAFFMLTLAFPVYSQAETILYINNGLPYTSTTIVGGDTDGNGEINMADVVILEKYILTGSSDFEDMQVFDLNIDGSVDIFDLVFMKKQLISSGTALTSTYSVDIVSSPTDELPKEKTITDSAAMLEYLSSFIDDDSEISSYSERYDDVFFKNNNLILYPFVQERGRGIFYDVQSVYCGGNGIICIDISSEYKLYNPLYPVTDTTILVQVAMPKLQCSEKDKIVINDITATNSEVSTHSYFSPDGNKEIYITQESYYNVCDIRIYLRMRTNSLAPLGFADTLDGFRPFNDDGEWTKDSDGHDVFGDGKNYSITWFDDYIIIEHAKGDGTSESFELELAPQQDPDSKR